ncbi:MAG TPA: TIGR01777 family oxidoreductase [Nitrospira sp.]|nr:TIGR01777 family oxidoreductase [Nitrospira sp.]
MHIILTGGSGFIGRALCRALSGKGHRITVLTTHGRTASQVFGPSVTAVQWNGRDGGAWEKSLEGADAVVNLAGAPIADGRWTNARKRLLTESRVQLTRCLVEAISQRSAKPRVLISASGIGFYGPNDDALLTETSPRGDGFLAELCVEWEREAGRASDFGTRVVLLRTGMVLERDGGALPKMLLPFRLFVGGPIMPGTQWVSWIHRDDHVRLIEWALATPTVSGPINAVAPEPERMQAFCATLGRVLHRPSWLPVPEPVLSLGLGELGTVMTTGQRVSPEKALHGGYMFKYPTLELALRAILKNSQA